MSLESSLHHLLETSAGTGLKTFASDFDCRWVQLALEQGDTAKLRNRKLPPEAVVWLVIGMALFRDHSIADVVRRLELVVPNRDGTAGRVVDGSIPKARTRIGDKPLRRLFELCSRSWAQSQASEDSWRDLAVYAIDGTTLTLQDTDDVDVARHRSAGIHAFKRWQRPVWVPEGTTCRTHRCAFASHRGRSDWSVRRQGQRRDQPGRSPMGPSAVP